ncbi:MAG: signal recognition particle-docking protein FtsY [Gemmatimonadota bacterium]|nr:signal recognition particle-docking protein FtsY [Gemmatimonadota bacterium]
MGVADQTGAAVKRGLWHKIKTIALTDVGVLVKGLDRDTLERVERVLLEADFGPAAFALVEALEGKARRGELRTVQAMHDWLVGAIAAEVHNAGGAGTLAVETAAPPAVILVLGVNGVGKTTQCAKLAWQLQQRGTSVLLAAADTYRAGAVQQLEIWAERLGVPCVTGHQGGDPAAVVFDAIDAAAARGIDVVLADTAGRLHTQGNLMDELRKIVRVVRRKRPDAPQESLLVLDGTVGQNAIQQGRAFTAAVPVTGLIVTKLDGTAKGGAVAAIRRELGVPIRFVGVGEAVGDLEPFDAQRYAERLLAD